jgi:hypothetical protein
MAERRKRKERVERKDLFIEERTLLPQHNSAEEQQHWRERNKEQGSVIMLHLRNKQQRQRKQQHEGRCKSPPARMKVTRHLPSIVPDCK